MKHFCTILISFCIFLSANAQIDIATAKQQAVGSTVTVAGVVIDDGQFNSSLRYIQDATGGIAIFDPQMQDIASGTEIQVTGSFEPFNDLSEIVSLTNLTIVANNVPLPNPVTISSLSAGFAETYECMLVRFENVSFVETGSFSTSSANYLINDGSVDKEVRVWAASGIGGTPIPSSAVNMIGVMGQYLDTYQLQPRDINDIDFGVGAPILTTSLVQSNITTNSFDVSFETLNPGNTIVNYSPNPINLSGMVSDAALETSHSVSINGLQPATVYYVQGTSEGSNGAASESAVQLMMTASESSGEMRVYFNRPVDNSVATIENAQFLNESFADTLINFILSAEESLDIAIYNTDNQNFVIDAINQAYSNGIAVRVVADYGMSDASYNAIQVGPNKKRSPEDGFQNAPSGGSYSLMHNKFIIKDANSGNPNKPWILTGSTNWTDNQLNVDANNMVMIQDQSLARAYMIEFEEMFVDDVFGPEKKDNTPKKFVVDGKDVELYFSPSDDTERFIKEAIATADNDLYVALLAHTRWSISYAIEDLIDDGVFIAGLVNDTGSSSAQDAFDILNDELPDTWIVSTESGQLHHKYLIVDPTMPSSDPLVLTGSHNWSSSAQNSNDENTIIIHDANIANQFYQEWRRRYTESGGNIFVGIADIENEIQAEIFSLFPNPTQNILNVVFKTEAPVESVISVIDLTGKVVKTINQNAKSGTNNIKIATEDLQEGMYIIKIEVGQFAVNQGFVKM